MGSDGVSSAQMSMCWSCVMDVFSRDWGVSFAERSDGGCSLWSGFLNEAFWWVWVAERVGEIFCGFGGETCRFPASDGNSWIGWIGFAGGEMVQLVAYLRDERERLRVQWDRHCRVVGDKKRCVENTVDPW